ncbi:MAG: Asp-tRNA(Asn)/Glu-tRNA(Gln) amidotransferase subunit GatA [Candidatus Krumholzibacteria bacterium]|nr:Asp-tRNA(Asn)/Glu-tRNA(Gln) amidotransferase subunit GatA [Candidatus Krumholzibacteria bacterium]
MRLNECGLAKLVTMAKAGEISPLDVASHVVAAVEARERDLRVFLDFDKDELLQTARSLTDSGDYRRTPLCGMPVMIKDNICVKDKPISCGSRILTGYKSPYDATVVVNLRKNGAIIGGKTNLDEFAMGSSTENSAFGPTRNPWSSEHAPGGSSGGSAAAVAADMAIVSLGSDTGGSIRQPASFCGVVGMKPTYGRVSRYGLVAFASSLDQIGPVTKSVEDSALMLNVMCGEDANDATSLPGAVPDFAANLDNGLKGLTFGVPRDFLEVGMDESVKDNFDKLVTNVQREGARVVDVSMPHAKYAVACYYIIANAEASSNLARFDGVKYGHRTQNDDDIYAMYVRTRDEGFGDEVKRRILLGTYVLSAGYYDAYYLQAQKVRSLVVADFAKAHERCDMVMLPTAPSPAFKLGEKIEDPLLMYLSDVFTIPINLAGLPGVSIPTGLSADRLPFGVQFIGRPLDESTLLQGARAVEKLVDFREKPFA